MNLETERDSPALSFPLSLRKRKGWGDLSKYVNVLYTNNYYICGHPVNILRHFDVKKVLFTFHLALASLCLKKTKLYE
jgi:hypothetical protein